MWGEATVSEKRPSSWYWRWRCPKCGTKWLCDSPLDDVIICLVCEGLRREKPKESRYG